jgi:phosphatidylglycerophosphate synthase
LPLFIASALSDFADGAIARRWNLRTRFGAVADPLADKLTMITVTVLLAVQQALPWWFALAVVVRDALIVGGALAYHVLVGRVEMAPSRVSKLNTALEFLLLIGVLAVGAGHLPGGAWLQGLLLVGCALRGCVGRQSGAGERRLPVAFEVEQRLMVVARVRDTFLVCPRFTHCFASLPNIHSRLTQRRYRENTTGLLDGLEDKNEFADKFARCRSVRVALSLAVSRGSWLRLSLRRRRSRRHGHAQRDRALQLPLRTCAGRTRPGAAGGVATLGALRRRRAVPDGSLACRAEHFTANRSAGCRPASARSPATRSR